MARFTDSEEMKKKFRVGMRFTELRKILDEDKKSKTELIEFNLGMRLRDVRKEKILSPSHRSMSMRIVSAWCGSPNVQLGAHRLVCELVFAFNRIQWFPFGALCEAKHHEGVLYWMTTTQVSIDNCYPTEMLRGITLKRTSIASETHFMDIIGHHADGIRYRT